MVKAALEHFWELVGGIFALNPTTFARAQALPDVWLIAAMIVLAAGLSRGIAAGLVLFINRVNPIRFAFSLLLEAALFAFGYLFWAGSIWLVGYLVLPQDIPFSIIALVLGLSYAPYLFSFLGSMPYLGVPILRALAVWNLLAMVVGFSDLAQIHAGEAFWHVILGWVVLQTLQQTVGQPIANLGHWLANRVAGVQLISQKQGLAQISRMTPEPEGEPTGQDGRDPISLSGPDPAVRASTPSPRAIASNSAELPPTNGLETAQQGQLWRPLIANPRVKRLFQYGWLVLLTCLVVILFVPLRQWLIGLDPIKDEVARLIADLVWVGVIALVIGGLLAPLEALGWWAGWYGEGIETNRRTSIATPDAISALPTAERYVVYLDGIGQTTRDYQPAVANFLMELTQRLPRTIVLIEGLMSYSVLDRPLTQDRPLAFFWRWATQLQGRLAGLVGFVVNMRNVMAVAVSADLRYGPIYNRGIAQQIYDSLIHHGYRSNTPITLIGYSGGGQISMGTFAFLTEVLEVPIEVISLGGVISGNVRALEVEHLYHLVGDKDPVERIGPIVFPRRWHIAFLSSWNRAKQMGKISFTSLGPVSHQGPTGMMAPRTYLPDGRSHLQQTLDRIMQILGGDVQSLLSPQMLAPTGPSDYKRYLQADFNHPNYYPLGQTPDPDYYRPIGAWMGRLILPTIDQREEVKGVLFEIYQAEDPTWIGRVVPLRWQQSDPNVQDYLKLTVKDVHFSAEAEYSQHQGLIHPRRINHWRCVDPLESLAGSHPVDDIVVTLTGPVVVQDQAVYITHEPIQISGRYYALVQIVGPTEPKSDRFRVVHFNRSTHRFDGKQEIVQLSPVLSDLNGTFPAVSDGIEASPCNQEGWYIYGALDRGGIFVVQAIAPRRLLSLRPDRVICDRKAGFKYIQQETWQNLPAKRGTVESVLVCPGGATPEAALAQWQVGDRALLMHVYGGIGGNQREPAAKSGLYFGHFAYGVATVIQDPIADEPRFDIHYHQIYTHNIRGLTAGSLGWTHYLGDRQWGFLGTRPTCDVLVKLPAYTDPFDLDLDGKQRSALDGLVHQLEIMTARYRIGDGTGGTYVGPANNCAQDSNQALYYSIKQLEANVSDDAAYFNGWQQHHPDQVERFNALLHLRKALQRELLPFGSARADWDEEKNTLGSSLQDYPLKTLGRGLMSWRTLLPRVASNTVAQQFLKEGASLWVLRTNQVGGENPDIELIAPIKL